MKHSEIKHFENLHILLWLVKDSCWMLELKVIGSIAFFPTIIMATYICVRSYPKKLDFAANLAVASWIMANASWMFYDFYQWPLKPLALGFFILGLLIISYYVWQVFILKKTTT
jgi:hypothetical protein